MALSKREFETTYREWEGPLYNFAFRWVFDPGIAEDIVHEAFVKLWRTRDDVKLETMKGLLYKTVQNLALNERRRRRIRKLFRISNFVSDEATPSAESQLIAGQDLAAMRTTLEALPLDLREVLLLSQFSDMSYAEIAVSLGIPEGTVASRKNRAILWMRKFKDGRTGGNDE